MHRILNARAMVRLIMPALCLLAFASLLRAQEPPRPDPSTSAAVRAVVESGRDEIFKALRDTELSKPEKSRRVAEACRARIGFDTLSRLSLGPAWKELTPAQREEFVREFTKHALAICSGSTDRYGGEDFEILADKPEARGDWTVNTRITRIKEGTLRQVAKVDFRLRRGNERWEVIDVTIAGISLANSFRAQFTAIMKDGGFDRLIQLLREKNTANQSANEAAKEPASEPAKSAAPTDK